MTDVPPLLQHEKDAIDDEFRERAQCVLAIDKMVSDIRATLHALGKDQNTYIFFSADNGYHMGEYSFLPGKMTPFDTDIQVPLIVIGPGVPHQTVSQITQTVDLAPTFTELGGNTPPTEPDGHSLVPLLHGPQPPNWREMALIEHHGPPDDPNDPDKEKHEKRSGDANPPNYEALRSNTYLYVEYSNVPGKVSEYGYYDLDPKSAGYDQYELKNVFTGLPAGTKATLHDALVKNETCGETSKPTCWQTQQ
jgi:hypothetical protein